MAPGEVVVLDGECPDEVYRGYRNDSDFDSRQKKPKPKVFYRRETEEGLSVSFSADHARTELADPRGVCKLVTRDILDCEEGLTVVSDRANHANIMGVPLKTQDEEKATRIARYLSRIAEDTGWEPTKTQR
jgi:asparagine synthetase B (glutamine-hydrolysing)